MATLSDELRDQAVMHPLDVDLELLNAAATRIEALESALVNITEANNNWAMNIDDEVVDAIQHFVNKANSK